MGVVQRHSERIRLCDGCEGLVIALMLTRQVFQFYVKLLVKLNIVLAI